MYYHARFDIAEGPSPEYLLFRDKDEIQNLLSKLYGHRCKIVVNGRVLLPDSVIQVDVRCDERSEAEIRDYVNLFNTTVPVHSWLSITDVVFRDSRDVTEEFLTDARTSVARRDTRTSPTLDAKQEEDSKVQHVVMLIHGIRSWGAWCGSVERAMASEIVRIVPVKYGWVPVIRFLLLWDTSKNPVKRVAKEFRSAKDRYPGAKISLIAHSFGTHVVTQMLREHHDIKPWRIILCGSVVKQAFDWDGVASQIGDKDDPDKAGYIVNDCGNADVWPALGASAGWKYGNAGTDGFGSVCVKDRFHRGAHGLFFDEEFIRKYWQSFLEEGVIVPGDASQGEGIPWYVRCLQTVPFLHWLALPMVLILYCIIYVVPPALIIVGVIWGCVHWLAPTPQFDPITFSSFVTELRAARDEGPTAEDAFVQKYRYHHVGWDCLIVKALPLDGTYRIAPDKNAPREYQALAEFLKADEVQSFRVGQTARIEGTVDTVTSSAIILYDCEFALERNAPPKE